jgi:hypothetical protein
MGFRKLVESEVLMAVVIKELHLLGYNPVHPVKRKLICQCSLLASCWILARLLFNPEDGNMFL